jgi:hypothetical protein
MEGMGGGQQGMLSNSSAFASALKDPGLGYVVIAGLMTIYQPPKEQLKETEQPKKVDAKSKPTTPAGVQPKGTLPKTGATGKSPTSPDPKSKTKSKSDATGKPAVISPKPDPAVPKPPADTSKSKPAGGNPAPENKPKQPIGKQPAGKT